MISERSYLFHGSLDKRSTSGRHQQKLASLSLLLLRKSGSLFQFDSMRMNADGNVSLQQHNVSFYCHRKLLFPTLCIWRISKTLIVRHMKSITSRLTEIGTNYIWYALTVKTIGEFSCLRFLTIYAFPDPNFPALLAIKENFCYIFADIASQWDSYEMCLVLPSKVYCLLPIKIGTR